MTLFSGNKGLRSMLKRAEALAGDRLPYRDLLDDDIVQLEDGALMTENEAESKDLETDGLESDYMDIDEFLEKRIKPLTKDEFLEKVADEIASLQNEVEMARRGTSLSSSQSVDTKSPVEVLTLAQQALTAATNEAV